MVDARDLKSLGRNPMWVRFPPPALGCKVPQGRELGGFVSEPVNPDETLGGNN